MVFISWTSEEPGANKTVETSNSYSQYDRHIVSRREGVVAKQLSVSAPDFPRVWYDFSRVLSLHAANFRGFSSLQVKVKSVKVK